MSGDAIGCRSGSSTPPTQDEKSVGRWLWLILVASIHGIGNLKLLILHGQTEVLTGLFSSQYVPAQQHLLALALNFLFDFLSITGCLMVAVPALAKKWKNRSSR